MWGLLTDGFEYKLVFIHVFDREGAQHSFATGQLFT